MTSRNNNTYDIHIDEDNLMHRKNRYIKFTD